MRRLALFALVVPVLTRPAFSDSTPAAGGHDFTATGKLLLSVGACGAGEVPAQFDRGQVKQHCEIVDKTQAEYKKSWVDTAKPWFAAHVPAGVPKKVVYPFAGGDLSTALTVFPDADEITTMSLEPAGDPRTLEGLVKQKPALAKALRTIEYELRFLYRVNFSNTLNMIDAMRGGLLPTQLIFGLSALDVHGYDVVALRYFKLDEAGTIQYLSDDDLAKAPDPTRGSPDFRNRIFANAEIQFKKPGGRVQVYRHIQVNLDNDHLRKDPRVLKHLEQKGNVAGMTKAASYLLSWDSFSTIRNYLIDHVQWMVSDATGVPPKYGKPKGFEYETYGAFRLAHITAGDSIAKDWSTEFGAQPTRKLGFRFGYYDGTKAHTNHLAIMRKPGMK